MIPHRTVEQVKDMAAANIVQIIGEYVTLRRSGASYKGCCPFHSEKTPSFNVNPARGTYYCFGCHEHGNAIGFVMKTQNISFPDAVRALGKRFGIDVQDENQTPEQQQAEREREVLLSTMEYATRAFEENLRATSEGQTQGLAYLRSRGFRDDTIATFRLGYSLSGADGITAKATAGGYNINALLRCGLTRANAETGEAYDYFRGRVMFPIHNASGKVIAFGGRAVDAGAEGTKLKYIVTPETELYKKDSALFGLNQAKQEMTKKKKCYVVEGYTDVVSLYQSGVKNVVAPNGTALMPGQLRLISRFTNNLTLLFDGNPAGRMATLRSIDIILAEGLTVSVLPLPEGEDPDSFARQHTPDEVQDYVAHHEVDFVSFQAQTLLADCGTDPAKKLDAIGTILTSIALVKDDILRELYAQQCVRVTGMSKDTIFFNLEQIMLAAAEEQRSNNRQHWQDR